MTHIPKSHHLDKRAADLIAAAEGQRGGDLMDSTALTRPDFGDEQLMDTTACAAWLGVSPQFLTIGRVRGFGPPFVRLSPRRTRYRRAEVIEWLKSRTYRSTAEYARRPSEEHAA